MDHKVEGFPFNIMRDPMYNGSTLCFIAHALWYVAHPTKRSAYLSQRLTSRSRTPAGLLLSQLVFMVYTVALTYER
jgi:phosphatidylethanolamine/phosphatidyl-N-methylethanolamine N-methyltransferase